MSLGLGLLILLLTAQAPSTPPCEVACNQQASQCLKACTGDPKDAQKPENAEPLMRCLNQCEAKTKTCKAACSKK